MPDGDHTTELADKDTMVDFNHPYLHQGDIVAGHYTATGEPVVESHTYWPADKPAPVLTRTTCDIDDVSKTTDWSKIIGKTIKRVSNRVVNQRTTTFSKNDAFLGGLMTGHVTNKETTRIEFTDGTDIILELKPL